MRRVILAGAGCGDPDLLTLKAYKAVKNCDTLLYDALISPEILKLAPEGAQKINVGKRSSCHTMPQDEINELLCSLYRQGKQVVRLKGGDPYVFGRGGEEAEALAKENIPFEIIPGISSAIAGPAYAGIPVTHRDISSAFAVITGHQKDNSENLDFENLARFSGTLIFLMGIKNLPVIVQELIRNGKNPATPAAVIERAATPNQRTVVSDLEHLPEAAGENQIRTPGIIVVGEVVLKREALNFYEKLSPLFGKHILVTRASRQASALCSKLRDLGAEPVELPAIKIVENEEGLKQLSNSLKDLDSFTHLIFTSVNAVEFFMRILFENGMDSRDLSGLFISAIGTATAGELEKYGLKADLIPENFRAEDLADKLITRLKNTDRILLPRSIEARPLLAERLSSAAAVVEIPIYSTEPDLSGVENVRDLLKKEKIDALTFTSSSTVRNFAKAFTPEDVEKAQIFSIGPVTTETLRKNGFTVTDEAEIYTIDHLVKTLVEFYQNQEEEEYASGTA